MNNAKHQTKRNKLSISILFCFYLFMFICDSCLCVDNNKSSETETTPDRGNDTNSGMTGKEPEKVKNEQQKNAGTPGNNKNINKDKNDEAAIERDKRAREQEKRKRDKEIAEAKEKEKEEKKQIQDQIHNLRTLIDNDTLSKLRNKNKDYKDYFSELLDFRYKKAAQNLINTKPEDINQKEDIDTWVANSKNFIDTFNQYVNNIHNLDTSIDTTIKKIEQDIYNQLVERTRKELDVIPGSQLEILGRILLTRPYESWDTYYIDDFLSPEDYVWMILLDRKNVNMEYNSLETLKNIDKGTQDANVAATIKRFCDNIEQIRADKNELLKIKKTMEPFLS